MARKSEKKGSAEPARTERPEPAWAGVLERRGAWIALGALALFLVMFFNPVFFAGKTFEPPDQVASLAHRPYLEEAFASSGSLLDRYPLWTPYIFSGMPSFGSLIAAPYTNPMSLLLTPIPGVFKVVTYYLLLGFFTWLYLRRRGLAMLPCLVGAAAYIFCAHVVTMIMFGHNSKIATLIFLPLVLLATEEIWRQPGLRWAAVLALAVGTMLVSSHLQIAYYTLFAAGIFMLVESIAVLRARERMGLLGRRWGFWIAGLALGAAASAVIFLPVREYAGYSIRGGTGGGLPYDYATNWSFHPLEMTTWILPSFMGFGGSTYWGWMPFTDFPHYMGILVLVLAVLTLVTWPRERDQVFLGILAVFSLLLAFGKHLPLLYNVFFEAMPYFNKFRVPSMMLVLFQFATAALAAVGLDRLLRAEGGERARLAARFRAVAGAVFAVFVILAGLVAAGVLDDTLRSRLVARSAGYGVPAAQAGAYAARELEKVKDMAVTDAGVVLLALGIGAFLLIARLRGRLTATAAGIGVLVLVLVDLWNVDHRPAHYYPRGQGSQAFPPSPSVEFIRQDPEPFRILPLTGDGLNNNRFAYYKLPSILGYHPAKLKIVQDVIDDQGPVGILGTLRQGNFNVVSMLNMKYVLADQEIAAGPLETVHRSDHVVMRNNAALPRMWFVDRARVIGDADAHLRALADPAWDPRTEALVFEDPGALDPGAGGAAQVTRYEPREIRADVDSPGNSLLVVSEIHYDAGWRAWIDGEPVPIRRVNYLLRGVVVPPGSHELRMRFDPASFRNGVYLSLGSYGLIAVILAGSWLASRRRAAPAS